jgi:hypothetical protein
MRTHLALSWLNGLEPDRLGLRRGPRDLYQRSASLFASPAGCRGLVHLINGKDFLGFSSQDSEEALKRTGWFGGPHPDFAGGHHFEGDPITWFDPQMLQEITLGADGVLLPLHSLG